MSLNKVASHLAAQGRGPDTTLVHMSPREVGALQGIARQHGGSLTINPQTGLAEAGFLDAILPMIAGAGLSLIPGVGPLMAAGIVGAGTGLLTKDLNKGLMAGLGAFGGASLAGGLMSAGTAAGSTAAAGEAATAVGSLYTPAEMASMQAAGMTPAQITASAADFVGGPSGIGTANMPFSQATQSALNNPATAGMSEIAKAPGEFLKKNMFPIGAAAAPLLLGGGNLLGGGKKEEEKSDSYIRPQTYSQIRNPNYTGAGTPYFTQSYTPQTPIVASEYGDRSFAGGGIVALAKGGSRSFAEEQASPGALGQRDDNDAPTVRELLEVLGGDKREKYERLASGEKFNPKDYSDKEIQAAKLLFAANKTKDPERYLSSLSPFYDAQLNFALKNTNLSGFVNLLEPNTAVIRSLTDSADTVAHELTHTLQLHNEAKGNKIGTEIYPYVRKLDSDQRDEAFGKALNRFDSPREVYANLNTGALLASTEGGDFVNSSAGRALLPDRKSQGEYYANTMPGVQSIYGYREDSEIPQDKFKRDSRDSYATQAMKYAKHKTQKNAAGGAVHAYAEGGTVDPLGIAALGPQSSGESFAPVMTYDPVTKQYVNAVPTAAPMPNNMVYDPVTQRYVTPTPDATAGLSAIGNNQANYMYDGGGGDVSGNSNSMGDQGDPAGDDGSEGADGGDDGSDGSDGGNLAEGGITNSKMAAVQKYMSQAQSSTQGMQQVLALAKAGDYNASVALNQLNASPNQNYAMGGGISSLGGYSDGGRMLKGPGDGVSDSIPGIIGAKQPARLADGEFVIPARIVSEVGNGSSEAGAKRFYAMMERIQDGRKKSIGKDKVAVDSKAYKHLPA
jgi:hypothetical protein